MKKNKKVSQKKTVNMSDNHKSGKKGLWRLISGCFKGCYSLNN